MTPAATPSDGPPAALLLPLMAPLLAHLGGWCTRKDLGTQRYLEAGGSMAQWLGRPGQVLVGATDAELFGGEQAARLRAAEQTALAQGGATWAEHQLDVGGARHPVQVLRWAGADHLLALWLPLSGERAAQRQLQSQLEAARTQIEDLQQALRLAHRELGEGGLRDERTGLYSRAHFHDQLERELDLSTREHRDFALVTIELDPQPDANSDDDRARTLEALGGLLRGNTRVMDASCRLDENHFALLLSGVGLATAHGRMEGLRRQCATQVVMSDGRSLGFTVSMGVASFPHTAGDAPSLLQACEQALQRARERGGNQVSLARILFDPAAVTF